MLFKICVNLTIFCTLAKDANDSILKEKKMSVIIISYRRTLSSFTDQTPATLRYDNNTRHEITRYYSFNRPERNV